MYDEEDGLHDDNADAEKDHIFPFIWLGRSLIIKVFHALSFASLKTLSKMLQITLIAFFFFFPTVRFQMSEKMKNHTGGICLVFLHCVFSNVSTKSLHNRMHSYIGCICCVFFTVCFQMFPQLACQRGCIVTLVAYVRLFPTVYHQMSSQNTCLRRCKVTLVAIVCFFSIVYFQISPQITCWRGCIGGLHWLHFFYFSPLCVFKCVLKLPVQENA